MVKNSFFSAQQALYRPGKTLGETIVAPMAYAYYDFTRLTGANAAAISNGNAGLVDQSGNGHTATIVGAPVVRDITINAETIKTLHDESSNAVNMNTTGATFLNTHFDVFIVVQFQDGQPTGTQNLLGGIKPTNIGLNIFLSASGQVGVAYGTTSGFFSWATTGAVFTNGVNETAILRIRVNFASVVQVYKNGTLQGGNFISGTISTPTPSQATTDFTVNMYIGALNNNGVTTTPGGITSILKVGFFPLLIDRLVDYIREYFMDFTWNNWEAKEVHVTAANAATLRANLIATVFNGAGLPALTPTVTTGITGAMHICNTSNITGFSSFDRLIFTKTDVDGFSWPHRVYHGHATTPNGHLVIVNNGHQSDVAAAYESLMSQLGALGYDVAYTAMPKVGDNTTTNPTVPGTSSTGHNQMLSGGLDRVGYNPLELFLFDKISAIDYLESSYTNIYMTGNSGGGWTTVLCAAIDERIRISFPNRGAGLKGFKVREFAGDYEQGPFPAYMWTAAIAGNVLSGPRRETDYNAITYADMLAMGASNGRTVQNQTSQWDDCCFFGNNAIVYKDTIKRLAGELGGRYFHIIDQNISRGPHRFSVFDIANIIHGLEADQ